MTSGALSISLAALLAGSAPVGSDPAAAPRTAGDSTAALEELARAARVAALAAATAASAAAELVKQAATPTPTSTPTTTPTTTTTPAPVSVGPTQLASAHAPPPDAELDGDPSEPADPADGDDEPSFAPAPLPAPPGSALADSAPVLLDRVEHPDGWATERLVEPSGEIVEHTVNRAGTVQVCRTVGSLLALRLVDQRPAAGGGWVHVARDSSGALVRYAIGPDGEPRAVSLLAPVPR